MSKVKQRVVLGGFLAVLTGAVYVAAVYIPSQIDEETIKRARERNLAKQASSTRTSMWKELDQEIKREK